MNTLYDELKEMEALLDEQEVPTDNRLIGQDVAKEQHFLDLFNKECSKFTKGHVLRAVNNTTYKKFNELKLICGFVHGKNGGLKDFRYIIDKNKFINDHDYRQGFMKDLSAALERGFKRDNQKWATV